ncbi:glycosyltransferase [Candidatus Roizmanbacteria bacterium]|nr:glycosyltransferase [Candidatus Roizmanbacteria bacterium]
MKISIITPSYNQGLFIEETIKSVLSQNYPDLEYIVVDGGSTDNTLAILKKYTHKLKWISEKDKGQTDAINKGLKMSSGDIVAFINSDDVYLPGTLRKISKIFKRNKNVHWLSGDYVIIDQDGKKIQFFIVWYKKILRLFPFFSMLSIANFVIQPSTFWRKNIVKEIGFFDERLRYTMDYDYWLRVIQKYPLYIIHEPLSLFRIHKLSKGGSQFEKQFQEEFQVIKKYTSNKFLQYLHAFHNFFIINIYKWIK